MTTYTLSCFMIVCTVVSSFAARDVPYCSRLSPRYSIRGDAYKSVKYLSNSGGKGTTYLDASRLSTTPLPWPRLQYIEGSSRAFSTRTMEALAVRGGNTDSDAGERLSPRRRRGLFLLTYLAYVALTWPEANQSWETSPPRRVRYEYYINWTSMHLSSGRMPLVNY